MYLAANGIQPQYNIQYNPLQTNIYNQTVAILLSYKGYIPKVQWMHNIRQKDVYNNSIKSNLLKFGYTYQNDQFKHDKFTEDYFTNDNIKQMYIQYCNQYKLNYNIVVPSHFQFNEDKLTFSMFLAKNRIKIPQQWSHSKNIKDNTGKTVHQYLIDTKQYIPEEWDINKSKIKNKIFYKYLSRYCKHYDIDQQTILDDPQWCDNDDQCTFSIWLAKKGIIPPQQMQHDTQLCDKHYNTVALYLAMNDVPIPTNWEHSKYIMNKNLKSVQSYFQIKNKAVPQQWSYEAKELEDLIKYCQESQIDMYEITYYPYYVNNDVQTFAMWLIQQDKSVPEQFYHDPTIKDIYGRTVAMYLAINKKEISNQWKHDPDIYDQQNYTVAHYLASNGTVPTECWVPSNLCAQTIYGNTIAMLLAAKGITPPQQYNHYPLLYYLKYNQQNHQIIQKDTVALLLAAQRLVPPKQWLHNKYIRNLNGETVQDICLNQCISVPPEWQYDESIFIDVYCNTKAMIQAKNGQIPDEENYHDPYIQNTKGYTVAMYLAENGIEIPEKWRHCKFLSNCKNQTIKFILKKNKKYVSQCWDYDTKLLINQYMLYDLQNYCMQYKIDQDIIINNPEWNDNQYRQTYAMYLAKKHYQIPIEFYHNPLMQDIDGNTTGIIISQDGEVPDQFWNKDIYLKNDEGQNIIKNLYRFNITYHKNKFVFNVSTLNSNDICSICLTEGQQKFVDSICNHKICIDCFYKLLKNGKQSLCPVCRKFCWYYPIDKQQYDNFTILSYEEEREEEIQEQ